MKQKQEINYEIDGGGTFFLFIFLTGIRNVDTHQVRMLRFLKLSEFNYIQIKLVSVQLLVISESKTTQACAMEIKRLGDVSQMRLMAFLQTAKPDCAKGEKKKKNERNSGEIRRLVMGN